MEAELVTLLRNICPRVHPDYAPPGTQAPWVTYQHIGGQALRHMEGTPVSIRHSALQIDVWHTTKALSLSMARAIEDAICTYAGWQAEPIGELTSSTEPDLAVYGSQQDFDIWAVR